MAGWQSILEHVKTNRVAGSPPIRMIPNTLLIAELYDAIERDAVPRVTTIADLFSDDIHLNDLGAHYIALAITMSSIIEILAVCRTVCGGNIAIA